MGQIQVITGVERRRRWSIEQKRAIVAAAFAPGAIVTEVARQVEVCSNQIYRWRRELRNEAPAGFAEVVVAPTATAVMDGAVIDLRMGDSAQVRIPLSSPPELAAAVVNALVGR